MEFIIIYFKFFLNTLVIIHKSKGRKSQYRIYSLFLENASRKCLASGEWDNLTDYGNCLRFPSSVEDVASDISLYIYLVGMEA